MRPGKSTKSREARVAARAQQAPNPLHHEKNGGGLERSDTKE
jgi:hypothetical protein